MGKIYFLCLLLQPTTYPSTSILTDVWNTPSYRVSLDTNQKFGYHELQDGHNEVECKLLAKNINDLVPFDRIKFNINVESD